ncbi:hypothetical protein F4860DRAFT_509196 [Xylaria cubensis]|nr:hypothetical protein F4860DRAFT_509196 [Xylaria cubensis]
MQTTPEPIAIIGSGCRFPGGSNSPSKLWELLKNPGDLSAKVPSNRFNVDTFYHPTHHGTTNATKSYFLDEDVTQFRRWILQYPADGERSHRPPTTPPPRDSLRFPLCRWS